MSALARKEPTVAEVWRDRRQACENQLFLVNRRLADEGYGYLRDTERGRELVAMSVLYEVGPGDTAYQIIDDFSASDSVGEA